MDGASGLQNVLTSEVSAGSFWHGLLHASQHCYAIHHCGPGSQWV